ncbi:hypothetical protein J5N97_010333 [Dioscorea zingiberensis]|uniref:26S proteasome non-ATPase regulatory subunit 1/RPN2 N-terminal domain-containing protein n=1 Tax=Dioscorea zingiberensis TaxID=325984 RepID=A0A9D5CZ68_9LILI|nr:hypothetical protein J5N97_010333 [Dioscorea zingiberensis]
MVSPTSNLLSMLWKQHRALKLHQFNSLMHLFWPEISTSMLTIEGLYEDEEFDQRHLAALVASKIFYYSGGLHNSSHALGTGPLSDISEDSDFAHTLLAKAIDEYASLKPKPIKPSDDEAIMNPSVLVPYSCNDF